MLPPVLNNPMILIGVILLGIMSLVVLVVVGIMKRLNGQRDKEIFEHQDIEKLIKPEIRKLIDYWGTSISQTLRYRFDEKGVVFKQLDLTQDVNKDGDYDGDADSEVSINEEQLEQDYEDGRISKRVYKLLKEYKSEPVHILVTRPQGVLNTIKWIVGEKIMNQDNLVSRIIIVPERLLRDDVDYLTITKNADFRRFAGMDVAVESSAFRFIESIGFKNLYSQSLQDQQNYHKQVNFYSSRFSQELQKLEKISDLESQKYAGKNVDLVNED